MDTNLSDETIAIIRRHPLGSLATVSPDGQPRSAFVYITADESLNLYFMTRAKTKKYEHITNNPRVAISIADEEGYETIQAEGVAHEEHSAEKQAWIIDRIFRNAAVHPTWQLPINQMENSGYVFMRVDLTWLRLGRFHRERGEHIFDQIIPQ
ncbi:MAG TPA: pyridoxamine 5'-phosphate oxidase family protein [Candidatus Andersenbacteria bacterium]|nr:pyridoxamine 5'-phosphate oxidase family protein [Candidatus Andersenbacteria bacterium]